MLRWILPALLLVACDKATTDADLTDEPTDSETDAPDPTLGLWRSTGWGFAINVDGPDSKVYEVTGSSCYDLTLDPAGLGDIASRISYAEAEDQLTLLADLDQPIAFRRMNNLPPRCTDTSWADAATDATAIYDIAAGTIGERYAWSDKLDGGWSAATTEHKAGLTATSEPADLFAALEGLIQETDDPSLRIDALDLEKSVDGRAVPLADADQMFFVLTLGERYMNRAGEFSADGVVMHGTVQGIPYISITRLTLEAADVVLDLAADYGPDGFILDLRFVDTGLDTAIARLANGLATQPATAWTLAPQLDSGSLGATWDVPVVPLSPPGYNGPIAVLTSGFTAGAGERLAIALATQPTITVIGERTHGSPGATALRHLPNGWLLWVPHQRVTPESLSPDITLAYDPTGLNKDPKRDNIVDRAVTLLSR